MRYACLAIAIASCSSKEEAPPPPKAIPCKESAGPYAPLSTRCGHMVDAEGRVVILRGINARIRGVFDVDLGPGKVPLHDVPEVPAADFVEMRRLGFDVLRLPMNWSGIEPNDTDPPTYDAAYLDRVARVAADAKAAGMYVLLDFHQDAYSKYIGQDGAPLWAIVPPPDKILEGPLHDLSARVLSPQVQRAFATFFGRDKPEGKRLRARFSAMAAAVAARFAGETNVVGIDLFNEPLASDDQLRAFHEEVGAAIRKVDPKRLLFFEPPGIRNLLDSAKVPSAPLSLTGVVYAPHVYTKVFTQGCDDACRNDFSLDTLRPSSESARAEADGWKAPLFVGEWGFGPGERRYAEYVSMQLDLQDEYFASSAYWVWKENSEGSWGFFDWDGSKWSPRVEMRKAFLRVMPRAIAGWPERIRWDASARRLELIYLGDPTVVAPTVVHVPLGIAGSPTSWKASCDGRAIAAVPDDRGDLSISCAGSGEHRVVVEASP